jgi:hypothetical protein
LAIFLYVLLIFFRGDKGADTQNYISLYVYDIKTAFIEPGFYLLSQLVKSIYDDFTVVLALQSLLIFFSLNVLLKKTSPIILVFYISFFGLTFDLSTLRQSLAFHSFILLSYNFKNKFYSLFSVFFHLSSLFGYIICKLTSKFNLKILLIFITLAGFYIFTYINEAPQFINIEVKNLIQFFGVFIIHLLISASNTSKALTLLFFLPIGFRLFAYNLLFDQSYKVVNNLRGLFAIAIIFVLSIIKILSFSMQSIELDLDSSPIYIWASLFL